MAAAAAFSRAISVDSNFARAWSGLADAYVLYPPYGVPQLTWEDAIGRAEAAARRAISIDGSLAEAHASLGLILDAKWQWEEAGQAFQQAIALNPRYASAHQWYGIYLIGLGRLDEGLEHLRTAFEMDRLSPIIGSWVALALDALGRTEEASAQFAHVLDYAPNAAFLHRDVWLHHMRSGDAAAGALHLERYLVLSGASSALAASWRAGLEDSVARDATLRAIADSAANDFKLSVDLNARLGRADIALALLQQRTASPARLRDSAGALRVYVLENAVREDSRFIPILQRMGLPTVAVGQNRR